MKVISEESSAYSIIDLNLKWIEHKLLIMESALVKFVKSPRIYPFPLRSNFIKGTYYHNGSLIPVISLTNYFDPSSDEQFEVENVLLVRTSNDFLLALSNVQQEGFTYASKLNRNNDFNKSYSSIFKSNQLVIDEYEVIEQIVRAYLIDLDYLHQEIIDEIRTSNNKTLLEVKNQSSKLETIASNVELDSYIAQHFEKEQSNRVYDQIDALQLIFRVEDQFYAISTQSILTILSAIPLTSSSNKQFSYFKGVIKTMYGSANVFDLRSYFGATISNDSAYILIQEENRNYIFVVDEIVSYLEIPEYSVITNVYPITGTANSFYYGLHILSSDHESSLVYMLSADILAKHLFSRTEKFLGSASEYVFEDVTDNTNFFEQDNQMPIAWLGDKVRIGFSLDQIKSIDSVSNLKFEKDSVFGSFNHPIFGEIPVFNLDEFYKFASRGIGNLVVLQRKDEFFGIYISGDISVLGMPNTGNLDNLGFDSFLFQTQKHLVQDFAIYEDFIGYLLSIDEIYDFLVENKENPVKFIEDEKFEETIDYFLIESSLESYCFPLNEIEDLVKSMTIDTDIYDLDKFAQGNLLVLEHDRPLYCIKLKGISQYFSTVGAIDVVKFSLEEIQEELKRKSEKSMVSLKNGNKAIILTFKEVN